MAKPKQILTDKEKRLILALYELGKTDQQIADVLGLKRKTFTNILSYNELTTTTIKKGIADMKVETCLYANALSGNITAQIFWLCNRQPGDWHSVNKLEHSGAVTLKHDFEEIDDEKLDKLIKRVEGRKTKKAGS